MKAYKSFEEMKNSKSENETKTQIDIINELETMSNILIKSKRKRNNKTVNRVITFVVTLYIICILLIL